MEKKLSILSNACEVDVRTSPYPHLVIKNALEPELFAQLAAEYPDPQIVLNGREKRDTWYDYPACLATKNDAITPLWKEFMQYHTSAALYQDVISLFGEEIKKVHPKLEKFFGKPLEDFSTSMRQAGAASNPKNYETDVSLECQFYVNYTEQPKAVRGPHVDRPTELYAALLYFRSEDDESTGSDLDICEAKNPSQLYPSSSEINVDHIPMEIDDNKVNIVDTAKYEANTLVFFINTKQSIHAVSPRSATKVPRRHINFTADLFGIQDDPLFTVNHTTSKKIKLWLQSKPIIWRLSSLFKD